MEDEVVIAKKLNYEALVEMSNTEGWTKIIKPMLESDYRFADGLLSRPKPCALASDPKAPRPEPKYITDPHEIGRARAIKANAKKYLDLVANAQQKQTTV
jgi:hypothetical protein